MVNTRFEAYKIKRELKRSGILYDVKRKITNDFGEKVLEPQLVGCLLGLYHEQNSNIQILNGTTTRTRTEKIPMILCLNDDIKKLFLEVDDYIIINGKKFIITGITNIQEWGIISDISLEVVDNGNSNL